jgi:hypothetical protein
MRITTASFLLLTLAPAAWAQDPARNILERAVVAHGGVERLSAVRADKVKLKGTLFLGKASAAFTDEIAVQAPGQFKSVVRLGEGQAAHTVVHLLDGEKATILVDGRAQPVTGAALAQMRQTLQLDQAMKLVPLLRDPAFHVSGLGEYRYNGRVVVGVRVEGRGQRDLRLYFDKETALLVKSEHLLDNPGGPDVRQEAYYADYRDVGGYRRPGKVTAYRDGKLISEAVLVEAQRFSRLDPAEFSKP